MRERGEEHRTEQLWNSTATFAFSVHVCARVVGTGLAGVYNFMKILDGELGSARRWRLSAPTR